MGVKKLSHQITCRVIVLVCFTLLLFMAAWVVCFLHPSFLSQAPFLLAPEFQKTLLLATFLVLCTTLFFSGIGIFFIYRFVEEEMEPLAALPIYQEVSQSELGGNEIDYFFRNSIQQVEECKNAIKVLEFKNNELQIIFESMQEAVIAIDTIGRILAMNPAAQTIFRSQTVQTGQLFAEQVRQPQLLDLLTRVQASGQEETLNLKLFLPEEKSFEVRARQISSDHQVSGVLIVLHDTTRLVKLEEVRREFVANVSHELRTPLTSIQGYAETLLSGALEDPPHNREFVETIQEQASRLSVLVNELLDLSAIESGRRKIERVLIDPTQLIQSIVEALLPVAKKFNVMLAMHCPDSQTEILTDAQSLRQILLNLIDNAIKFNRENGWVRVECSRTETELEIAVTDGGVGISEKDLTRVFERFYRVDKARSHERGGTGLGLSIVKHLTESIGARLTAESQLGKGSCFKVFLPLTEIVH